MKDSNQMITRVLNTRFILKDAYQRPLDEALVRKIVAHWNPDLMNLPKVSHRDGKYYVFDGQHTIVPMNKTVDVVGRPSRSIIFQKIRMNSLHHLRIF